MMLIQYLSQRGITEKSLTKIEAKVAGVPWPLVNGWVKNYGYVELSEEQLVVMRQDLARLRRKTHPETNPPLVLSPGLTKKQHRQKARAEKKGSKKAAKEAMNILVKAGIEKSIGRSLAASQCVEHALPVAQKVEPNPEATKPIAAVKRGYDGFYETREWRALRYKALVMHGPTCQCCGATRGQGVVIHVDHVKPRSKFPALQLDIDNLQILCEACNLGKSNKDQTDWR